MYIFIAYDLPYYQYNYLFLFYIPVSWLQELGASPCSPVPPCVHMRKGRHNSYYSGTTHSILYKSSGFQHSGQNLT